MPPLSERIKSYLAELKKWEDAGKPTRSKDRIAEIYDNCCAKCEHLTTSMGQTICNICGCFISKSMTINKIAWKTTRCPHEPPLWVEELEQEKNIVIEKEKPQIQSNESAAITKSNLCCN